MKSFLKDNCEHRIFIISLGSNTDDRQKRLNCAISWLTERFELVGSSDIYETTPVGGAKGQYSNAVVVIKSELPPEELERRFKDYEIAQGRDTESRLNGFVPIDLDILVINNEVIRPRDYNRDYFKIGYAQIISDILKINEI